MRAGIAEANHGVRREQHLPHVGEVAAGVVEQRHVEESAAVVLDEQVEDLLDRVDSAARGAGGDAVARIGLVVDRIAHREQALERGEQRRHEAVQPGARGRVLGDEPPAALRVTQGDHPRFQVEIGDVPVRRAQGDRVDGRLQALQHTDRPGRDLHAQRQVVGNGGVHPSRHLPPAVRHVLGLLHGHRQRTTRLFDDRPHQAQLVADEVLVGAEIGIGDHLHHAAVPHRADECDQLVGRREAGAERGAAVRAVGVGPARREAERAGLHAFSDRRGHGVELVGSWRLERIGAALPHDVGPQRRVGHVGPDVEHEPASLQRVEVLREGLPIPRQTLGQRGAGDVLDTLQHADQPVVLFDRRAGRGEADAAVAHDE